MKKQELERMLMDPEGIKTLRTRAEAIKARHGIGGATAGAPASARAAIEGPAHAVRPTKEEYHANDRDFAIRSDFATNLVHFVDELDSRDPREMIEHLMERTKKNDGPAINCCLKTPFTASWGKAS